MGKMHNTETNRQIPLTPGPLTTAASVKAALQRNRRSRCCPTARLVARPAVSGTPAAAAAHQWVTPGNLQGPLVKI